MFYYGVVDWFEFYYSQSHEVPPAQFAESARPDRRLLRWYAMRRVVLLVGPVLLCTSRMRPVVEIGFLVEPGLGR